MRFKSYTNFNCFNKFIIKNIFYRSLIFIVDKGSANNKYKFLTSYRSRSKFCLCDLEIPEIGKLFEIDVQKNQTRYQ